MKFCNYVLACGIVVTISGCGGGGGGGGDSQSAYVQFAGNANGEYVLDANNTRVRFRATTRSMEVSPDQQQSDITLDGSNNLVQGESRNIGTVALVDNLAGGKSAAMLATDGSLLAVSTSGSTSSLARTALFPSSGSGSGTGTGTGNGTGTTGGTGNAAACGLLVYPGDTSDLQVYPYDAIAQQDSCLYAATGEAQWKTEGDADCQILQGLLAGTQSTFHPLYCIGNKMKTSAASRLTDIERR